MSHLHWEGKQNDKKASQNSISKSTANDLGEYRSAVYRAINNLEGFRCERMENFTSQPTPPEDYIAELVASCDLFVGIIGLCYGSHPPNSTKSYTEIEYDKAREANIPCLMFLTTEDFPVPGNILQADRGWNKQKKFRAKISRSLIRSTFKDQSELVLGVVEAIRNWEQPQNITHLPKEKKDCIILSGGYSQRLWPLTIDLSKHLLPVGGHPALFHVLNFVRESALIKNIYLLTNPKFSKQIKDFLKDYRTLHKSSNIDILVEPNTGEGKLGPVGALGYAINYLEPRDFLILAGDNLFGFKLDDFIKFALMERKSSNAIYKFPSGEDVSEYGVVSLSSDNTISDFKEKQAISTYSSISTACYFLHARDASLIPAYLRQGGNPDSLGSFVHWLMSQGSLLKGYTFSSFWFDVGTREKLLESNWKFLIDSRRGQIDQNSYIEGPVQIESNSTIRDSKVGPYAYVGANVEIVNSEVQNSLIMNGSSIRYSSIKNSIIGPNSRIEGNLSESVCEPGAKIKNN